MARLFSSAVSDAVLFLLHSSFFLSHTVEPLSPDALLLPSSITFHIFFFFSLLPPSIFLLRSAFISLNVLFFVILRFGSVRRPRIESTGPFFFIDSSANFHRVLLKCYWIPASPSTSPDFEAFVLGYRAAFQ